MSTTVVGDYELDFDTWERLYKAYDDCLHKAGIASNRCSQGCGSYEACRKNPNKCKRCLARCSAKHDADVSACEKTYRDGIRKNGTPVAGAASSTGGPGLTQAVAAATPQGTSTKKAAAAQDDAAVRLGAAGIAAEAAESAASNALGAAAFATWYLGTGLDGLLSNGRRSDFRVVDQFDAIDLTAPRNAPVFTRRVFELAATALDAAVAADTLRLGIERMRGAQRAHRNQSVYAQAGAAATAAHGLQRQLLRYAQSTASVNDSWAKTRTRYVVDDLSARRLSTAIAQLVDGANEMTEALGLQIRATDLSEFRRLLHGAGSRPPKALVTGTGLRSLARQAVAWEIALIRVTALR